MSKLFILLLLAINLQTAQAQEPGGTVTTGRSAVELSIIKTSDVTTLEAFTYSGGDYTKAVKLQHVAVLVRHPKGSLLFDTGLGRNIDAQFKEDMPLWARPFFSYGPVTAARPQLDAAGYAPIERVFLSHGHWDHASALVDFPEAQIWLSQPEKDYLALAGPPAVFPSQLSAPSIKWKPFKFNDTPYGPFAQSLDVFEDGSVVFAPLAGHSPGSIVMYVTLGSGKKFLFVGDAVWKAEAIAKQRPKMWISSRIVDNDKALSLQAVGALTTIQASEPTLVIVPAHDAAIHDALGAYFPQFLK
ncbi:MAG: MBL fold metallo-hydrolase [Rhodocyclaceae bacterium]|jgi:glyoxylase-like metal-dependent hydrolase (beta-lactamase superfamily II)|nr:MBL fold metallo-hydrolase [Rhodocyclaceae bacterium]MBK6908893.1 MBL fold metallo-hydrolase [Rhodocyclaceae bacterium]